MKFQLPPIGSIRNPDMWRVQNIFILHINLNKLIKTAVPICKSTFKYRFYCSAFFTVPFKSPVSLNRATRYSDMWDFRTLLVPAITLRSTVSYENNPSGCLWPFWTFLRSPYRLWLIPWKVTWHVKIQERCKSLQQTWQEGVKTQDCCFSLFWLFFIELPIKTSPQTVIFVIFCVNAFFN